MTTNLMIGIPSLTDSTSSSVSTTGTFESARPVTNLISGGRSRLGRISAANTGFTVTFDTGSAASRTIDYLYIAKANIIKAQLATRLKLAGGTSGDIAGISTTLQSLTLYGRNSQDAIFTSELANSAVGSLSSTATNQTYILTVGQSGVDPSTKWALSQVMFGQWFDFGRDPIVGSLKYAFETDPRAREAATLFTFTWEGISKTVKDSAISSLVRYREKGCILYTRTLHSPLLNRRVVHALLDAYEVTYAAEGSYNMTIRFREQI